jgi:four helix bundle protein
MSIPLGTPSSAPRRPLGSYRELAVWQLALKLAVDCNRLADGLPTVQRFGLGTQIRRAACSVLANIAEGYGRLHRGDYVHHLSIARGSLKELETHLLVARHLRHLPELEAIALDRRCTLIGRMLSRLIASLYAKT